jgi:hypothetical protein
VSQVRRRRAVIAVSLAACGAAALPSPAAASDETLRQEIQTVFVEVRPALIDFRDAAERAQTSQDTRELQGATDRLRDAMRRYKWGVVNRKSSSRRAWRPSGSCWRHPPVRHRPRRVPEGARPLDAGASRGSIVSALRTADRRITEAARDEAEGLEALGVPATA